MRAELLNPSDPTLFLKGEIRDSSNDKTVVSTVYLRAGVASTFQLTQGQYYYLFHVEVGAGTFDIEVAPAKPASFDTSKDGEYGLSYSFKV